MNIKEITEICDRYNIYNYKINNDGSVDVNGNVNLSYMHITKLPLKFNIVKGNFFCNETKLITLDGSPKEVSGSFDCSHNMLTSLEHCPKKVGRFIASHNILTSLEGCPEYIETDFICYSNELTTLKGIPSEINGNVGFSNNLLTNLNYLPKYINGYLSFEYNNISKIDVYSYIKGDIYLDNTSLDDSIKTLNNNYLRMLFRYGNEYNIYNDNIINNKRFNHFINDFKINEKV